MIPRNLLAHAMFASRHAPALNTLPRLLQKRAVAFVTRAHCTRQMRATLLPLENSLSERKERTGRICGGTLGNQTLVALG